jgi:hypothetical protein
MGSLVRLVGWILKLVLRVAWTSTMLLIPLFGFWLASSMAAYRNASQWLTLLGGLALFPLLPVAWELFYLWRRAGRPQTRPILTGLDRLVLRTLVINGLFLGGMLWRAPETAFRALSVRGDWFLDGQHGETAEQIRGVVLDLADRFERRWHRADDRYGHSDAAPDPVTSTTSTPVPRSTDTPVPPGTDTPVPGPTDTPVPPGTDTPVPPGTDTPVPPSTDTPKRGDAWPLDPEPDVAVREMPDNAQTSIESVGKYLAQHFSDPRRLVKAIHDYVALRLHYDDDAFRLLMAKDYEHAPSQEAEAVFAARTGVCAGYAKLMVALGKAAGVEIAYVTGYIRDATRRTAVEGTDDSIKTALEGYSHAWNAAKLDGQWLLVDATWDDSNGPNDPIESTYLFTPPKLFVRDHLPADVAWQLLPTPVTPGDFVRQPMMTPEASRLGLEIVEPMRSQVTVDGDLQIVFDNPKRAEVIAVVRTRGSTNERRCTASAGAQLRLACHLGSGEFEIRIYAAPAGTTSGTYQGIGSILANSR